MELVRAVGGDHEHRLVGHRGGEEAQERARGGVRPVEILDDEQHRRLARQPVQDGEQRLEHARLVVAAVPRRALAEPGQQRRELRPHRRRQRLQHRIGVAHERAHGRDERRVGQLALAQLDAVAAQHARAAATARCCSSRTRRVFPTPGLAGDEGERGRPSAASDSAASSSASSRSRPTRRLDVTLTAIPYRIAGAHGREQAEPAPGSAASLAVVADQREDVEALEPAAAVEEAELDHERAADHRRRPGPARARRAPAPCRRWPAGRRGSARARRRASASACISSASMPYSRMYSAVTTSAGSLPGLRAGTKPALELARERGAEDEAARLRRHDELDVARARPVGDAGARRRRRPPGRAAAA